MDKTTPPMAFGVFKPVGHIVIAFRTVDDQQMACASLSQRGFTRDNWVTYTSQEMLEQANADIHGASPLAAIGQELNLIKAHKALAEIGCSFVVVNVPDAALADQVADIARLSNAAAAQRYGRFIIEELVASPRGETQVFESPARGLDIRIPGGGGPQGGQ